MKRFIFCVLVFLCMGLSITFADSPYKNITLYPWWNVVSTPAILSSIEFLDGESWISFSKMENGTRINVPANATNIKPLEWYLVNNSNNTNKLITLMYKTWVTPAESMLQKTLHLWWNLLWITTVNNPFSHISWANMSVDFTNNGTSNLRNKVNTNYTWNSTSSNINNPQLWEAYWIFVNQNNVIYWGINNWWVVIDNVDCEDADVVLACLENLNNCPDACKADYQDNNVIISFFSPKNTVLLKKANTKIAEFTVKPDKWDDTYLESLAFVADINAYDSYLTADDVNVKIDGVAEDGETVYDDAVNYGDVTTYTWGNLVVYEWKLYTNAADVAHVDWDTNSGSFTAVPEFSGAVDYDINDYVLYNWLLYKAETEPAAGTWATQSGHYAVQANHVVFDLTQELGSDGVTVEVILKKKTAGTITVSVDDVNGAITAKTFTKRFEDALVWVADQIDNEWSTTFVLWVSKSESSMEISNVCLYYKSGASAVYNCVPTSISDGNDDLEWTNPDADGKQVMIDAITYSTTDTACTYATWDGTAWTPSATAGCVTITKDDYNDYFKVGSTYAKIFATK